MLYQPQNISVVLTVRWYSRFHTSLGSRKEAESIRKLTAGFWLATLYGFTTCYLQLKLAKRTYVATDQRGHTWPLIASRSKISRNSEQRHLYCRRMSTLCLLNNSARNRRIGLWIIFGRQIPKKIYLSVFEPAWKMSSLYHSAEPKCISLLTSFAYEWIVY